MLTFTDSLRACPLIAFATTIVVTSAFPTGLFMLRVRFPTSSCRFAIHSHPVSTASNQRRSSRSCFLHFDFITPLPIEEEKFLCRSRPVCPRAHTSSLSASAFSGRGRDSPIKWPLPNRLPWPTATACAITGRRPATPGPATPRSASSNSYAEGEDEDAPTDFAALGLDARIVAALKQMGFTTPTPVQAETLPALLAGGDVVMGAETGSGKTLAYVLPLLQRLLAMRDAVGLDHDYKPEALVLVPNQARAAPRADAPRRRAAPRGARAGGAARSGAEGARSERAMPGAAAGPADAAAACAGAGGAGAAGAASLRAGRHGPRGARLRPRRGRWAAAARGGRAVRGAGGDAERGAAAHGAALLRRHVLRRRR
jgi:hypothetical protein